MSGELNPQQQQAVEAADGPLMIIAGPGTGKTKTLTARIAYLIQHAKVHPSHIVALTFTNKAAKEMRERLVSILGKTSLPTIATFHALAQQLHPASEETTLIQDSERQLILKQIQKQMGTTLSVRDMGLRITQLKNTPEEPDSLADQALVDAYNHELAKQGLYDFDDVLLGLYTHLQQGADHPYTHILIDEFQDTNDLQYEILGLLNRTDNLFVIGDPLQSIYGFRGAKAAIFDRFIQDWPGAQQIALTANYRSGACIVRAAGALFPAAPQLDAQRHTEGAVRNIEVLNEYSEAEWIIQEMEKQLGGSTMLTSSQHHAATTHRTFKDFAVLYRTHAGAHHIQRALEASGIPYQIAGEDSPYASPVVATIVQSLRYLSGKGEAPAIAAHTTTQVRALLDSRRAEVERSLLQGVQQLVDILDLENKTNKALIRQFLNTVLRFDQQPLAVFLGFVDSLAEQAYYDSTADAVTLLTIHASKGLEFPWVAISGVEQGTIPHKRQGIVSDLGEEKRLLYVAMTRARDELYLLRARKRGGAVRQPSPFLKGLEIETQLDPALADQQRRIAKHQQKRAQGSLF